MTEFKAKFTVGPQHDSEGFTMSDAKCAACVDYATTERRCLAHSMCVCNTLPCSCKAVERADRAYDSPLRALMLDQRAKGDALRLHESIAAQLGIELPLSHSNPHGWQEVDGVQLPPITWADYSDDELEYQFQQWLHARTAPVAKREEQRKEVMGLLQRFATIDARAQQLDGVEPLSDSRAPDVFVGRR
jgi:hypothetical protein